MMELQGTFPAGTRALWVTLISGVPAASQPVPHGKGLWVQQPGSSWCWGLPTAEHGQQEGEDPQGGEEGKERGRVL